MGIVDTVGRHLHALDQTAFLQRRKPCLVLLPAGHASRGDGRALLQLRQQIGGVEFAGKEGGADVHPSIFIHLPPVEAAAIRALFADDFGALHHARIVEDDRAALAHGVVLGLVEAEAAHVAHGAGRAPLVEGTHGLCRILHHSEAVLAR